MIWQREIDRLKELSLDELRSLKREIEDEIRLRGFQDRHPEYYKSKEQHEKHWEHSGDDWDWCW